VVLQVPAPIVNIARTSLGAQARVLSDAEVLPGFDLHCPLLSLPLAFGTTLETVPAEVPYLAVDPALAKRWRDRIGDGPELRVGLVWAGNAQHKNDRNRSIALDRLAPIFGAAGIRWFSLQLGERKGELAQIASGALTDLSDGLTDFAQSAAALAALDLIITVDTAAAHLAGALAKPVWVLLPFVPDWRWLTEREDSPYYPTARLFRQPARGDWESVALQVRRALDERTGAAAKPTPAEIERLVADASTKLAANDPATEGALNAVLAVDPTRARAWHSLGVIAQKRGEQAKAAGFFRRAIALEPNSADTRNNLGVALGALGRREEAMACYRRALVLRPDYARANLNLGAALMDAGALEEAKEALQRAAALDPKLAEAPYNLGNLHSKQGNDVAAIKCFDRATTLRPDFYEAHNNLGAVLLKTDNYSAAYRSFVRALRLKPDEAEAHYNVAAALIQLGSHDKALASCRRAIAIDPDHAQANFSEAQILLARGNLREGFDKYEWRWRLGTLLPRGFSVPQWNGEALTGRTILLHGEQGYGDTIQGLRYVPLVAEQGGEVVLEVPQPLRRLAARLPGVARLVAYGEPLPRFDLFCPLLSLPRAFRTTLETIPADIPYLGAEPEAIERWRAQLSDGSGLRIGIVWAGSSLHRRDAQRSISIETLSPLLGLDGVRWFSLQVGERAANLALTPAGRITDLAPGLSDFGETAAAIVNLDLVITVDTAVAHLAGALGRKAWIMLPTVSDWRWTIDRDDSPWYPTLRLFRQSRPGDWEGVVARVREALSALLAPADG
jgi:Tfp pilus assembly protein PilF/ADP-heptose:LPS heptosyltransferase